MATNDRSPLSSVCETWRHPFGWELQLLVASRALQMSNLVRSAPATIQTIEEWRISMVEKGWRRSPRASTGETDPPS